MSRQTHPEKWDDPWFSELSKDAGWVFLYLCDKVNHAGFLEFNVRKVAFETKTDPKDLRESIIPELTAPKLNEDGDQEFSVIHYKGWIFLPNYIKRQGNWPVNPRNRAHWKIQEQVLEQITRFADVPAYVEIKDAVVAAMEDHNGGAGLPVASRDDLRRAPKDWDVVKQKCMTSLNPIFRADNALRERFEAWWDHRMAMGDPLEVPMWRELQTMAMQYDPKIITDGITYSIANGMKTINWTMAKKVSDDSSTGGVTVTAPAKTKLPEPEGWKDAFLAAFADASPPTSFWAVAKSSRKNLYRHDPHLEGRVKEIEKAK
jgi:hypothetical protein